MTVEVNDSQYVTLAQNDDLCASLFRGDQCDFCTKHSSGLNKQVSKPQKISQLDGEDEA